MPTPPRTQMASYLERWEEQKAQSRIERQKQQRRRSSGVGDELSFISAIERETEQHERYNAEADALGGQYLEEGDDSFDLPTMDAFPASELAEQTQEQQKMPAEDEFVDAGAFCAAIAWLKGLTSVDIDADCAFGRAVCGLYD